jgi:hypothetical protein
MTANVIKLADRRPVPPARPPQRKLTVVKCDDAVDLVSTAHKQAYAAEKLDDAIRIFRAVYGPSVTAEVLDLAARNERALEARS